MRQGFGQIRGVPARPRTGRLKRISEADLKFHGQNFKKTVDIPDMVQLASRIS